MLFVSLVFLPPMIVAAVFVGAEVLLVLMMTHRFIVMRSMIASRFLVFQVMVPRCIAIVIMIAPCHPMHIITFSSVVCVRRSQRRGVEPDGKSKCDESRTIHSDFSFDATHAFLTPQLPARESETYNLLRMKVGSFYIARPNSSTVL